MQKSFISRRVALRGLASIPATSAVPATVFASSDEQLLAFGRDFDAISAALDAVIDRMSANDESEQASLHQQIDNLLNRLGTVEAAIGGIQATTLAGLQVKARVACWVRFGDLDPIGQPNLDSKMALSIVRDLIRLCDPTLERPGALARLLEEAICK